MASGEKGLFFQSRKSHRIHLLLNMTPFDGDDTENMTHKHVNMTHKHDS